MTTTTALTPTARELLARGVTPHAYVDPFPGVADDEIVRLECPKCAGGGNVGIYWRDNGVCYSCNGSGIYSERPAKQERKAARERTNRDNREMLRHLKEREAEAAAADTNRAKFATAHPEAAEIVKTMQAAADEFGASLAAQIDRRGELSEKQIAAILRWNERQEARAAEAATAQPVVEGRQVITGEIVSTKWVDTAYGSALKMLVKDDRGFKVWGTHPEALWTDDNEPAENGQRVEFTATVETSRDDKTFGFFKRPTKARRA